MDDETTRVRPEHFLSWVERVQFEVPDEFLRLLKKYHGKETHVQSESGTSPDRREVRTIAQLFTVMAIDHLGYAPDAKRGPIPREISELAANHGITITDKTVRKYLEMGAALLPGEEERK